VIDLNVFANHLFLRPQYQHYYFGDYYAANYQAAGFYPAYSYNSGRYGYDPIYAHERWQHRQDGQWEHRVAADFQNRRDHEDARPPRTWAAQRALGAGDLRSRETNPMVAAPFSQFRKSPNSSRRFQPVDQVERQKLGQHAQEVQRFREQRQKLETTAAAPSVTAPPKELAPARVPLPRSPFVARPVTDLGKDHAPPQMYEAPKPDFGVVAKPRVNVAAPQPQQHAVSRLPLNTAQPPPQRQPSVERSAPQPRSNPAAAPHGPAVPPPAAPNQDKRKAKG
jgi:hypothetical protein